MKQHKIISSVSGVCAALCIIFFPILGGGWESITGLELLRKEQYIPDSVKACVVIAILCSVLLTAVQGIRGVIFGSIGLVCVFLTYSLFHSEHSMVECKAGTYLAMLAFAVSIVVNFITFSAQKQNTPKE